MFHKTIHDRFEIIGPRVQGVSVLDLGVVNSRPARGETSQRLMEHKPGLLFGRICKANPQTLGVDIDPVGVETLKGMGFNAVCADVETMDLGRRFDTIVAGEIIEHLENPGRFLRNLKRHLNPGGVLLISTPNPFYCSQTWKIWRHGMPQVHEDHVTWFDPLTMEQMLKRTGFRVTEGYWVTGRRWSLLNWKRLLRPYFSHSFLLVAQPE